MYLMGNTEFAGSETESNRPITLKQEHYMLGHKNKDGTIKTDKDIGFKLNPGNMEPYYACAVGKYKQKLFPRKVNTDQLLRKEVVFKLMFQLYISQRI